MAKQQTAVNEQLSAPQVIDAFKKANLPIVGEKVYTEETDPNHLLNRPNQYTGKINFDDKRAAGADALSGSQSIEVFANAADLESRKNYTETISKSASMFAQYIYTHKNILLRLDHQLTPSQAAEYEKVLKSL